MQETSYQQNYVPTTEQTFDNPALAPMNMNDSTVNIWPSVFKQILRTCIVQ